MADDTIRQGVIDDLLTTLVRAEDIRGAVDDYPPENPAEPPIEPQHGEAARPFAYVVDGVERFAADDTGQLYECDLPIEIGVYYEYERADAAKTCKRIGRHLLGVVQKAVMGDPNRGWMTEPSDHSRRKRALTTIEDDNDVGEAAASDNIGVAVWRGRVKYMRSKLNPASAAA